MINAIDDYCEHGNPEGDCDEICTECNHECYMHHDGNCTSNVVGYPEGALRVEGECDCDGFKD